MASIGRVRVGNPEEPVAATAVVLRFGVRLEHERRKTTDHRAPPVSEARREGAAGRARLLGHCDAVLGRCGAGRESRPSDGLRAEKVRR
jgi:hypothetical protein